MLALISLSEEILPVAASKLVVIPPSAVTFKSCLPSIITSPLATVVEIVAPLLYASSKVEGTSANTKVLAAVAFKNLPAPAPAKHQDLQ